jgi:hypothetical protein
VVCAKNSSLSPEFVNKSDTFSPHPSSHASIDGTVYHGFVSGFAKRCNEYKSTFSTKTALSQHSKQSNHSPHMCLCAKTLSHINILERHVQPTRLPEISFPYPHFKKYRGSKALRRRDHLTQHLRRYHHMKSLIDIEVSWKSTESGHLTSLGGRIREQTF